MLESEPDGMSAEKVAEAVGLVFGLLLVASSSATVWYLADAVEQEKGWYWDHKPKCYLLTGAAAEGLVVAVWLLFIFCCCGACGVRTSSAPIRHRSETVPGARGCRVLWSKERTSFAMPERLLSI
jgi:hypothetical protein